MFRFVRGYSFLLLTTQICAKRICEPRAFGTVVREPIPPPRKRKTDHREMVCFSWQRNRDSNPNIQSQSLLCYRYTIPLKLYSFIERTIFYHKKILLSIPFDNIFRILMKKITSTLKMADISKGFLKSRCVFYFICFLYSLGEVEKVARKIRLKPEISLYPTS